LQKMQIGRPDLYLAKLLKGRPDLYLAKMQSRGPDVNKICRHLDLMCKDVDKETSYVKCRHRSLLCSVKTVCCRRNVFLVNNFQYIADMSSMWKIVLESPAFKG
jgi:hypothetical protein